MKAVVIHEAGGPEVLKVESRPIPRPNSGQVLIRVKAFGLNRSELFTRQGHSPGVPFPRVLGIEAVGLVEEAPGNEFRKGTTVATAMGGMGRQFDGGYAEYTCVPASHVQVCVVPSFLRDEWARIFRGCISPCHPHLAPPLYLSRPHLGPTVFSKLQFCLCCLRRVEQPQHSAVAVNLLSI